MGAQAQASSTFPFATGDVDVGAALDGVATQASGVAREGAGCLAGRSNAGRPGQRDVGGGASCWGGSGEERAPCRGTLRRRGRPEVRCAEGLGAAEEDTTVRVRSFFFLKI